MTPQQKLKKMHRDRRFAYHALYLYFVACGMLGIVAVQMGVFR